VCQIESVANSAIEYKQVRGCDVRALSFDAHSVWVRAHWSSVQVLRDTSLRVGFTFCNCHSASVKLTMKEEKTPTRRL
jgi:hypothetical protein